jgi:hypothetical protein
MFRSAMSPNSSAPNVAHGGEPGRERLLAIADAADRVFLGRSRTAASSQFEPLADRPADQVHVTVDETGEERPVAQVDERGAGGDQRPDRIDLPVLHEHDRILRRRPA